MKFYGDTCVHIGNIDRLRMNDDERKGRTESIEISKKEVLLGCTIDTSDYCTFGVTWLKWTPPRDL